MNEGLKARVAGRRAACPVVAQCLERGGPTLFGARDSFESLIKALGQFFERRHMCKISLTFRRLVVPLQLRTRAAVPATGTSETVGTSADVY